MTNRPLPDDYAAVLADLKRRVSQARYRAQRQVNAELIRLYWQIASYDLLAPAEQAALPSEADLTRALE